MNYSYKDLYTLFIFSVIIACIMGCGSDKRNKVTSEKSTNEEKLIVPGEKWFDTDGEIINAHGVAYSINEGPTTGLVNNKGNESNAALVGVTCYSSNDLYTWKNEGIALS